MKIVISLGGSLISLSDLEYLKKFAEFLNKHKDIDFYIVIGGGKTAREYINAARRLGAIEKYLDRVGIEVTRLNAMLLNVFFGKRIPHTIKEAGKLSTPVIMGGTTPGHSTDAVAALLSKEVKADMLIIATDVDGIYDKDPKKYKEAKMFEKLPIKKLKKMVGEGWKKAGENVVVDPIACDIIEKEKIKTIVINGKNLNQLENAIYGKLFKGTEIVV